MDSRIDTLIDIQDRYRQHLTDGIMAFWLEHGPDTTHGGFHGGLHRNGDPIPRRPKSLVQHARFLWSFSAAYRFDPRPAYQEMATRALDYLLGRFYDRRRLGWHHLVSRRGRPLGRHKHLYAQSFAIYGLSEYALAFRADDALALALETFGAIDRFGHDSQWGGYRESFTGDWAPSPQLRELGASGDQKTMNTHLHLLEAFTTLYRASGDTTVRSRLEELVELCLDTMVDPARGCAHQFFEPDWSPLPSGISFGHDIECSWLLTSAAGAAAAAEACGMGDASSIREASLALSAAVAEAGVDGENGGLFYEGDAVGRPTERQKVWWVQAEGLIGFLNAYALSGDESFLDAFRNVERWVFARQVDREHGEWHNEITPRGRIRGDKGSIWKTPYHTARACIELAERSHGILNSSEQGESPVECIGEPRDLPDLEDEIPRPQSA